MLYTDGLSEATRDVLIGHALVCEATRAIAATPGQHPAANIHRHVLPNGASDDVAILVVRVNFAGVEQLIERRTFEVDHVDAARATRDAFVRALQRRNYSPLETLNAELVFGELVGNVLRHAGADAAVEVAIDSSAPQIVLHVLDRGPSFRHISRLPADPYAESGRGLFLIAAMTDEFTVSERPDGGSHVRAVFAGGTAVRHRPQPRHLLGSGLIRDVRVPN